ncbi:hypothetical protein K435DRAFT_270759 [Dendrothele bispora CBS 962.96]|uniref:Uncharacterized protein n=1 Tax=Dendrothele bispora (strain CBS 962.96) TaxID=1314807 RepID=A0A4S8LN74_DENBC|nr:hypothetical protein K435DRAFT_270736 [Dendrothele bispora CBS 962.96]THU90428.1 hypothetical protein K435DRAFT_270759 [Dendrothele bispora CBS 962.96]
MSVSFFENASNNSFNGAQINNVGRDMTKTDNDNRSWIKDSYNTVTNHGTYTSNDNRRYERSKSHLHQLFIVSRPDLAMPLDDNRNMNNTTNYSSQNAYFGGEMAYRVGSNEGKWSWFFVPINSLLCLILFLFAK